MIYVAISMNEEAKPIIGYFHLKKNLIYTRYEVFESQKLTLILIRTKSLFPAIIIGDFFSNKLINRNDFFINFGIAGSSRFKRDEILQINAVHSFIMDKTLYPSMIYCLGLLEGSLYSAKNIVKEDIGYDLYDLEGYSFYYSGLEYFKSHQMILLKVAFDSLDNIIDFNRDEISDSIKKALPVFDILCRIEERLSSEALGEVKEERIQKFFFLYPFSRQMKIELKKLFEYYLIIEEKKFQYQIETWINNPREIKNKNDLKEFYCEIRKLLL